MTGDRARRQPSFAFLVGVLLAAQTLGTMATGLLPAVAPKVAETYAVSPALIGYQISLLAAAMLVSLLFGGNLSVRWGACRVTQAGLVLLIAGCVVAALPHVLFVFLSAIALGLGYGLITPSASHLLARFTRAKNRNLIFSFKQTGVPLGGVGAAVLGPALAVSVGWQWSLAATALALALLLPLLERGRRSWDDDHDPLVPLLVNPLGGISTIWNHAALRLLSIAGGCFVMVQISVSTFTVVLFAEEMRLGLVQAGLVLMASQLGGIAGRIFWGWLADRKRNCFVTLSALAAIMFAAALSCIGITPDWPILVSCALFFVLGSTASGWNGAFLAEVARLSPRHAISSVTGASLFFVNVGKLLGPIFFTHAYLSGGSYALAFALLALPAAAGLACVWTAHGKEQSAVQPVPRA